jgi:hypothetical protein
MSEVRAAISSRPRTLRSSRQDLPKIVREMQKRRTAALDA